MLTNPLHIYINRMSNGLLFLDTMQKVVPVELLGTSLFYKNNLFAQKTFDYVSSQKNVAVGK